MNSPDNHADLLERLEMCTPNNAMQLCWEAAQAIRTLQSGWVKVEDELPPIGVDVDLFSNGVVQNQVYYLDAGDKDDLSCEYFWDHDLLDEGVPISPSDQWKRRPAPPTGDNP